MIAAGAHGLIIRNLLERYSVVMAFMLPDTVSLDDTLDAMEGDITAFALENCVGFVSLRVYLYTTPFTSSSARLYPPFRDNYSGVGLRILEESTWSDPVTNEAVEGGAMYFHQPIYKNSAVVVSSTVSPVIPKLTEAAVNNIALPKSSNIADVGRALNLTSRDLDYISGLTLLESYRSGSSSYIRYNIGMVYYREPISADTLLIRTGRSGTSPSYSTGGFQLFAYVDDVWVNVFESDAAFIDKEQYRFTFPAVTAQHWRIHLYGTIGASSSSLTRISVERFLLGDSTYSTDEVINIDKALILGTHQIKDDASVEPTSALEGAMLLSAGPTGEFLLVENECPIGTRLPVVETRVIVGV